MMQKRLVRRTLLAGAAILTAGFAAPAWAADPVEVAGLFTQSVTQGNWDVGGYQAFAAMAKKYGFKESHVEGASYEKAPAILRSLASRGVKLIICHSSGYAAAIQEVAPQFPDTPTVAEAGIAGFAANSWSMLLAPRGTPAPVVAALNRAVVDALAAPEMAERF